MQPEFTSPQGGVVLRSQSMKPMADAPRMSPKALTLVVIAHVGVIATLVTLRLAPVDPMPTTALMIDVIRADTAEHKTPDKATPKPAITPQKTMHAAAQSRPQAPADTPILSTESKNSVPTSELAKVDKPVALPLPQTPAPPATPTAGGQTSPQFEADYLNNPSPNYPPLSRRAGEEGKVVLKVYVEPNGLPSKVEVRTSSGYERLDKSATTAVGRWKFIPAKWGAEAVGAWVLVPIIFSLKV